MATERYVVYSTCVMVLAAGILLGGCGKSDSPSAASPAQTQAAGVPLNEQQKIAALLGVIEKSQAAFIRNDQEYPPSAARQLMEYKLKQAGDQIKTAQDFIDQVATRSKTTGRAYQVRLADGRTTESAFWLRARLAEIERRAP